MLERTLIFVDTSYLLASFYNSWDTGARAQLEIDLPEVVAVLGRMASEQLKQPIHRQYWYDGIPDSGPHRYQRSLRSEPGVQLRAGQLIEWGDRRTQKAVDTRLVADMVIAAMKGNVSDIILVSGDADMLPGVEEAVNAGVRVHLYGFGWDSMSSALRFACDTTTILDPREDFRDTMRLQILEGPLAPAATTSADVERPLGDAEEPEEPGLTPVPMYGEDASASSLPSEESSEDGSTSAPKEAAPANNDSREEGTPEQKVSIRESAQAAANAAAGEPPTESAPSTSSPVTPNALATNNRPSPAHLAPKNTIPGPVDPTSPEATIPQEEKPTPQATQASGSTVKPQGTNEVASNKKETPARPNPGMMARHRKLRSRYVPLPNEVWASAGEQNPYDIGQQYAVWWYDNGATEEQKDNAHLLTGGGLPPEIDRPLLQFACETLHEYTLTETQRVGLRDGFHAGIRGIMLRPK
ncbi:NYN domain protein [Corynebacterium urogenitale]|uniref:NYN domain protein n=1 Tax=Corynebacterium urogenitale TaxID=2487892 RepID=A0A5J6Z892_9CORY|nr:NYN domain-containing protein [Corynebacterium urogenitale]QFQ01559.1 NYN domain protein [Corynebacterium urogenitale]